MSLISALGKIRPAHLRLSSAVLALSLFFLGGFTLFDTPAQKWVAHGPIQSGHDDISCRSCHISSPGTLRQQIQANLKYAAGQRENPVDFGYAKVSSTQCISCHERSNERHPIYRFNEPRFTKALSEIAANTCLGCHSEHRDERSFMPLDGCKHCHAELSVKNDPLDIAHSDLIDDKQWASCLGCHDFHGNHQRQVQTLLAEAFPESSVEFYLKNGPSPYGNTKVFEGKSQ